MMIFCVGDLLKPKSDDEDFDDAEIALYHARTLSDDMQDRAFGVSSAQDEGRQLFAIAHNGELFVRVDEQQGGEG